MNIGKAIQSCRKARNLKQVQLAKQAAISVSFLSLLEQDKREPSLTVLAHIAEALGIPLSALVLIATEDVSDSDLSAQQIERLKASLLDVMSDGS